MALNCLEPTELIAVSLLNYQCPLALIRGSKRDVVAKDLENGC